MTDSMSGRARLARNNINILGITESKSSDGYAAYVVYEFQYRLPNGSPVWRKTFGWYDATTEEGIIEGVLNDVRALRRELENGIEGKQAD